MTECQTVERDIRAAAIAHAIRLGKCPKPGMVMGGKFQIESIEKADFEAGNLEKATPESETVEIEFTVTQDDIAAAIAAINAQRAQYRSPKTTTMHMRRGGVQ
jgi:hypothetical protein